MKRYVILANEVSGLRDPTYASGAASKHYVDARAAGSNTSGIEVITDSYGEILHTLSAVPEYWNVRPSGNVNFGITTKVDSQKIYVYLTAAGSRTVYWYASV